jgi:hypothetical protein
MASIRTSGIPGTSQYWVPDRSYLYFSVTFSVPYWNTNQKFFIGRTADQIANTTEPSNAINIIGIGKDSTDSTLFFMVNDGSASATEINTDVTPNTTDVYKLIITSPNDRSSLTITLKTLTIAGTTEVTHNFSTDLPALSLGSYPFIYIVHPGSGLRPELGIIYMYEEKFNLG